MKTMKTRALALATFIMMATSSAFADSTGNDPIKVDFKLIGHQNEQPVFLLNLQNAEEGEYILRFKFGNGETIYTQRIKAKVFEQRYRLNIENLDDADLKLEIRNVKTGETEVYEFRKNVRTIQETYLTKVS